MSNLYHKIDTVYKRDPDSKHKGLIFGAYSNPSFEYLAQNSWAFTEKIDGTNIRVIITPSFEPGFAEGETVAITPTIIFGGKSEEAQIPAKLVQKLQERFLPELELLSRMFPSGAVLYGEGFGAGIQKGGERYLPEQDFVLFDVRTRDALNPDKTWWLRRAGVGEVAQMLGLPVAPVIGWGTLDDMVEKARAGFRSAWGDFPAEGIVARPTVELLDRGGNRIITKIKAKDFRQK